MPPNDPHPLTSKEERLARIAQALDRLDELKEELVSSPKPLEIKPFRSFPISTMTMIIPLIGSVAIDAVFRLLKVDQVTLPPYKDGGKIPWVGYPGAIIGLKLDGLRRGITRNQNPGFKNAITIVVSTSQKNVNLKLSAYSMQLSGVNSKENGEEAARIILEKLYQIEEQIRYLNGNREEAAKIKAWLLAATKGPLVTGYDVTVIDEPANPFVFEKQTPFEYHQTIIPVEIPPQFNPTVVQFLLSFCSEGDLVRHDAFSHHIESVFRVVNIISGPGDEADSKLLLGRAQEVMVNYNYSLGFCVKRQMLKREINRKNGFFSIYKNEINNNVNIKLPYIPGADAKVRKKSDKIPHHTFIVYETGSVTQTGPNPDLMEEPYYRFLKTISQIRHLIEKPNDRDILSPKVFSLTGPTGPTGPGGRGPDREDREDREDRPDRPDREEEDREDRPDRPDREEEDREEDEFIDDSID